MGNSKIPTFPGTTQPGVNYCIQRCVESFLPVQFSGAVQV